MQITITEGDIAAAVGDIGVKQITKPRTEAVLGPEESRASVMDALPKAISQRVSRMIPEDYEIREIEIKIGLSGTPFGVGISGDATVTFGPRNAGKSG